MYNVQKVLSFRLRNSTGGNSISRLRLATTIFILGIMLSVTPSFWNALWHSSKPSAKAAASIARINVPFFTTAVPFNQAAIFWFGDITSIDNYTDVRVGYNKIELYIDLHIVDRHLWYDPNVQAPDLTKGDNATIYLNTAPNGSIDRHAYM